MSTPIRKRYYPSSAAFVQNGQVVTKYSSGCMRSILFSAHGLRTDLHPLYAAVGAEHEALHLARLTADPAIVGVERECPVQGLVYGHDVVEYSGRQDFVVTYKDGHKEIHECKATFSKNTRREFRKGVPVTNHLAQLVSYLGQAELDRGRLVYGYYEAEDNGALVCAELKEILVSVDEKGRILTDGVDSGFTAVDQLRHMQISAKHLMAETWGPRPAGWDSKWSSPCSFCVFRSACDHMDQTSLSIDEAFRIADRSIKGIPTAIPAVNQYNPKRRKEHE